MSKLSEQYEARRKEKAKALQTEFNELYNTMGDDITAEQAATLSSATPGNLYAYGRTYGINGGSSQYAWDGTMRDEVFNTLIKNARDAKLAAEKEAEEEARKNPTTLATLANGYNFTSADKTNIVEAAKAQNANELYGNFATALGLDSKSIPDGQSLYGVLIDYMNPQFERLIEIPANADPEQKAKMEEENKAIAERNKQAAMRAEAVNQIINNSDLDYDDATGKWSIIDRGLEAQLKEREKKKQELELQARLKAEEAKRNRVGIASLAASLGDMFRAGLGGPVTPRDLSAMYNQMDARQQKAYDTYLARQQYERELENQRELLAQQQAQKLASERAQREWEATKMDRQNQFTLGLHREDNAAAQKRAETQAQGRITAAGLSGKNATTKTQKYSTSVTIGGVSYGVPYESGAKIGHMEDALGAIKNYITDYVRKHSTAPTGFTDNTSEVSEASNIKKILDRIWSENYKERSNSATGDEIELTEQSLSAITGAISRNSLLPQSVKNEIVGILESVGYKKMDGSASTPQAQQAASGYGDDDEEGEDDGSGMF